MRAGRIRSAAIATCCAVLLGAGLLGYAQVALSKDVAERYAAKPAGWDSPAGKCVVCHSLERGGATRVAPNLWGIVGAQKGRAKGYGYSLALAKAGGVWTERDLDEYLSAPNRFLPGTSKTISGLPNAKERAELIAFLATLKD
ncbi:MAG: c-type cytochrome [Sterolibacteriaceae bacterium]|nr:c-type cytochrome [Candidatus Methylophosphatis haderslevensis]